MCRQDGSQQQWGFDKMALFTINSLHDKHVLIDKGGPEGGIAATSYGKLVRMTKDRDSLVRGVISMGFLEESEAKAR
jgi:hypothetical protein